MIKSAFIALMVVMGVISAALAHDAGYSRKLYGGWADKDRDCYNTRAEVLIRDNLGELSETLFTCRVISGSWKDAYSNKFYEDAGILDIDHLVPLSEAHRSGGHSWEAKKRKEFANDEDNLYVTHRSINRSKGGKGIDEWLPRQGACEYIRRYILVKEKYGLTLRMSEVRTLLLQESCKM